jgi:sulfur carrier protein
MQIIVNGNPTEVPEGTSMAELIERLELTGQRLAVEVNEELVPRSRFEIHRLAPGDRIEVIHAVGGG